eukprot:GHVT01045210.1.p1 GENE.GHVT01045210.1~~GHVT01045210.1.p1  ORF type:complete len:790 (+),score=188.29 GHVT01045210.1:368-2737(+)
MAALRVSSPAPISSHAATAAADAAATAAAAAAPPTPNATGSFSASAATAFSAASPAASPPPEAEGSEADVEGAWTDSDERSPLRAWLSECSSLWKRRTRGWWAEKKQMLDRIELLTKENEKLRRCLRRGQLTFPADCPPECADPLDARAHDVPTGVAGRRHTASTVPPAPVAAPTEPSHDSPPPKPRDRRRCGPNVDRNSGAVARQRSEAWTGKGNPACRYSNACPSLRPTTSSPSDAQPGESPYTRAAEDKGSGAIRGRLDCDTRTQACSSRQAEQVVVVECTPTPQGASAAPRKTKRLDAVHQRTRWQPNARLKAASNAVAAADMWLDELSQAPAVRLPGASGAAKPVPMSFVDCSRPVLPAVTRAFKEEANTTLGTEGQPSLGAAGPASVTDPQSKPRQLASRSASRSPPLRQEPTAGNGRSDASCPASGVADTAALSSGAVSAAVRAPSRAFESGGECGDGRTGVKRLRTRSRVVAPAVSPSPSSAPSDASPLSIHGPATAGRTAAARTHAPSASDAPMGSSASSKAPPTLSAGAVAASPEPGSVDGERPSGSASADSVGRNGGPYTRLPSLPGTLRATGAAARQAAQSERAPRVRGVARAPEERTKLHGYACEQCRKFYSALGTPVDGAGAQAHQCHHAVARLREQTSRHRYFVPPPDTPAGFWDLHQFDPDTQPAQKQQKLHQQKQHQQKQQYADAEKDNIDVLPKEQPAGPPGGFRPRSVESASKKTLASKSFRVPPSVFKVVEETDKAVDAGQPENPSRSVSFSRQVEENSPIYCPSDCSQ